MKNDLFFLCCWSLFPNPFRVQLFFSTTFLSVRIQLFYDDAAQIRVALTNWSSHCARGFQTFNRYIRKAIKNQNVGTYMVVTVGLTTPLICFRTERFAFVCFLELNWGIERRSDIPAFLVSQRIRC